MRAVSRKRNVKNRSLKHSTHQNRERQQKQHMYPYLEPVHSHPWGFLSYQTILNKNILTAAMPLVKRCCIQSRRLASWMQTTLHTINIHYSIILLQLINILPERTRFETFRTSKGKAASNSAIFSARCGKEDNWFQRAEKNLGITPKSPELGPIQCQTNRAKAPNSKNNKTQH